MGSLFAGYGHVFPNYIYLGSELGMNIFGANETELPHSVTAANFGSEFGDVVFNVNKSLTSKTTVKRNTLEPFLDVKFGFLSTPTALVYLRGGINYNDIRLKQQSTYQASGSGLNVLLTQPPLDEVSTAYTITNKDSRSGIGYRLGAGTEFLVTPSMGIGFDYVYSFYPKVKHSTSGTATDVACYSLEGCVVTPGTFTSESKATSSDQEVLAKLIYHFG
jgi:opacity protein-like surface antigen